MDFVAVVTTILPGRRASYADARTTRSVVEPIIEARPLSIVRYTSSGAPADCHSTRGFTRLFRRCRVRGCSIELATKSVVGGVSVKAVVEFTEESRKPGLTTGRSTCGPRKGL